MDSLRSAVSGHLATVRLAVEGAAVMYKTITSGRRFITMRKENYPLVPLLPSVPAAYSVPPEPEAPQSPLPPPAILH